MMCTSIEQSQKLIELGIDINTADIVYTTFYGIVSKGLPMPKEAYDILEYPINGDKCVPAWSLSALLDIIPNWTMDKTDKINLTCNLYYHCEVGYNDPVDAAFEMVYWLKENGKI